MTEYETVEMALWGRIRENIYLCSQKILFQNSVATHQGADDISGNADVSCTAINDSVQRNDIVEAYRNYKYAATIFPF